MKGLSVIIVNYNTSEITFQCIQSIIKFFPFANYALDVVVVDNNSNYDDYKKLEEKIASLTGYQITLVRKKRNSGFAGGNMEGVEYATGDFLFLVNNDVIFINDAFTPAVDYLNNNSNTGVCGGTPLYEDGKKQEPFGHTQKMLYKLLGNGGYELLVPGTKRKKGNYTEPTEVDYIQGCFMCFKTSVFKSIGGLDTNLFLYFEELDISERLRKKGLNTMYLPGIEYIHLGGKSTDIGFFRKKELAISNLYTVRKNYGYLQYFLLKNYLSIAYFFKSLVKPKYFSIWWLVVGGGCYMTQSLKHKQIVSDK